MPNYLSHDPGPWSSCIVGILLALVVAMVIMSAPSLDAVMGW